MAAVTQAGVGLTKYLQVMSNKRLVRDGTRVNLSAVYLGTNDPLGSRLTILSLIITYRRIRLFTVAGVVAGWMVAGASVPG